MSASKHVRLAEEPKSWLSSDRNPDGHALRLREADHRVGNSLQLVLTMISLQRQCSRSDETLAALDLVASRIAAIGTLHRHLADHADDGKLELSAFLQVLGRQISDSTGLHCTVMADQIYVTGSFAQSLAVIINELAINACKHGYESTEPGIFAVHCVRRTDDFLEVSISNRGKSLEDVPTNSEGLGLKIVASMVQKLHGELTLQQGSNVAFRLRIPLNFAA